MIHINQFYFSFSLTEIYFSVILLFQFLFQFTEITLYSAIKIGLARKDARCTGTKKTNGKRLKQLVNRVAPLNGDSKIVRTASKRQKTSA